MPDTDTPDLTTAIFAKTALGQQEIQTRSLGLSPLAQGRLLAVGLALTLAIAVAVGIGLMLADPLVAMLKVALERQSEKNEST